MTASSVEAKPADRASMVTVLLCFLVAVLEGYDLQVISSAGPALQKALHLSPAQIGFFFSSSLVGLAAGAVAGGWLADHFGRKPVLVWSVFALGLFTFATALADNFEMILATRILAGVGLGGAMPTLIALMAEISSGKKTTSAVTTMICGQPLGGVISGLVGRTLAMNYGWESLFLVGGVLTMVIVPLLWAFLPETHAAKTSAGTAKMPVGKALFGEGRGASSLLLWAAFILTLALLSILLSWTPLLVIGKGLPRPVGINAIIAINLGGILGGLFVSRMIDRFGVRWPMFTLYAVMAASLYIFAHSHTPGALMFAAVLVGFGVLGAQFSLYGVAPRVYPPAGRGSGVGVAVAMGRIGSVMGPIIIGGLISQGANERQAILVMTPVAVAACVALLLLTLTAREALSAPARDAPAH